MRQAIFFDIDETIYTSQMGQISERVKKSIRKAQQEGFLCFISTGRSYGFVSNEIKQMQMDGFICANGSHIVFKDEDLFIDPIHTRDVQQILQVIQHMEYNLESTDYTCISPECMHLRHHFLTHEVDRSCFKADYDLSKEYHKVLKIEIWINSPVEEAFVLSHAKAFAIENHRKSSHIELFNPRHTKASGAQKVAELLDISLMDSYSFGDSDNDVALAGLVGHPIAMENGNRAIKQSAQDICPSVMEDGVAIYLEQLVDELK